MFIRSLTVFALILTPVVVRAADEKNPYQKAKVGDYATYKVNFKSPDFIGEGKMTQTVTAKSDKEVTIELTGSIAAVDDKLEAASDKQIISLTAPYDPFNSGFFAGDFAGAGEFKHEKLKDGKEKLKVNGKEYDCTWTTYKTKNKHAGQVIEGNMKVWTAQDVLGGMVKLTMTVEIAGEKSEVMMELTETGNKK